MDSHPVLAHVHFLNICIKIKCIIPLLLRFPNSDPSITLGNIFSNWRNCVRTYCAPCLKIGIGRAHYKTVYPGKEVFLVLSQSVMVNSKLSFLKSLLNVLHVLKIILEKNQSVLSLFSIHIIFCNSRADLSNLYIVLPLSS